MAVYRSLRALINKNPNKSRSFLTTSTSTSLSIQSPYNPLCFNPFLHPSSNRFLSPLSRWIAPFQGPLFLSSTPWKLSQSATPLYLRSGVVLRKVEALNLNLGLLRSRARASSPAALGARALAPDQALQDLAQLKVPSESFVESFVNAPNLISMSRLLSGPFLGWYLRFTLVLYSLSQVLIVLIICLKCPSDC